ncbi:MAG: hypothetical protein A2569_01000 [Candidatus Vogelbacteria bacterium RIFOXYD1_FULL_51_18]|uniref:Uncharacterized protein n=1 Tax=Candidatus Vogelbacteria bacterium RIFOXYD1_FULL_51_18 TaxID=1802440 RepID=A0A1G2QJK2_9BACT|nr:MAG: hypothetical protein A2569_01000 [Candidatus Vogelbacteria bacterium RIFOXYD1_FULL_51_18]
MQESTNILCKKTIHFLKKEFFEVSIINRVLWHKESWCVVSMERYLILRLMLRKTLPPMESGKESLFLQTIATNSIFLLVTHTVFVF